MSEERSGGRNRRGRRRYFHPKKEKSGAPETAPKTAPETNRPPDNKSGANKTRKTRRRTRSRQRVGDELRQPQEVDVAYVAPQAVFVYTYSTHPELRDAYEFRPEHFSSVGRRLEDFHLDLSKLFPHEDLGADGTPVMAVLTTRPEFNWDEWEE